MSGKFPAHAATHSIGGSDPITPKSIGAAAEAAFSGHAGDTVKHITGLERTEWNSKAEGNHSHDGAYGPLSLTATIPITGWAENATTGLFEVTVSVTGMQAAYVPVADITAPNATAEEIAAIETAWALVKGIETADGSITVRATGVTETAIPIVLKVR